jgi:hypothetical protein
MTSAAVHTLSWSHLSTYFGHRFHFQLEVRVRDLAPEALGIVTRGAQDPEAQAGYAKLVPRAIGTWVLVRMLLRCHKSAPVGEQPLLFLCCIISWHLKANQLIITRLLLGRGVGCCQPQLLCAHPHPFPCRRASGHHLPHPLHLPQAH